jgi:hypothetical protein
MILLDTAPHDRAIAYVTDVEGIWSKLVEFATDNPLVSLDGAGRLSVAPGALFVFGGDAIDRGPSGRRVVRALLDVKLRQPSQVVLLAGNRDINKLRLWRELNGFPPKKATPDIAAKPRAELLRWIFENTMGARAAFEHRRSELQREGRAFADEEVAQSFVDDLAPGGDLRRYLASCQLSFLAGQTLFVHGGVTEENLGMIPGNASPLAVPRWVEGLNAWYREQVSAFEAQSLDAQGVPHWEPLIAYQAPLPGSRTNQKSVVYGRLTDDIGTPYLPPPALVARLEAEGVQRVILGHTPSGDSPSLLRAGRFALVLADTSYSRLEAGARVLLRGEETETTGRARLDSGEEVRVRALLSPDGDGLLGLRDPAHGGLLKGFLDDGTRLLYKPLPNYQLEQVALAPQEAQRRRWVVPFRVPAS